MLLVWLFDRGAAQASQALAPLVPTSVQTLADQPVDGPWPALRFALHLPDTPQPPGGRALLVWIHGGWVSGRKEDVANYLRIVAARSDLAVASLDYTLAPEAVHPTQLQQVHAGLLTLRARAESLGFDPQRIVLAGDSAGAQLAAQLAAAITHPGYGQRLGVPVQTLYFPDDRSPPLGHEYQFNLADPAGEEALRQLVAFLSERLR